MPLRNSRGSPVDPVPFLVATVLGALVCFSYGPIYLREIGLTLTQALVVATLVASGIAAVSYHRYVWAARPDLRAEVPGEIRFRRLLYGILLGLAVLALLALPLL